jgi:glycosyltransferase involved in cell wall biosynthesis
MTPELSLEIEYPPKESLPLRVAVVTETYPPDINGVALTLAKVVDGLRQRGHVIWLIRPRMQSSQTPDAGERFEEHLLPGMPIPFYRHLRFGFPAKKALIQLWSQNRPDVVHIATEGPLGWSALKAADKLKIPVSTDFRTNFHAYTQHYRVGFLKGPIIKYLRKFHNAAGSTMVPTHAMQQELHESGFLRLHVVPRGVDTELFHPEKRDPALRQSWGANEDCKVMVCVARLAVEKNLELVVRAWRAFCEHQANTKLVLVGDGPLMPVLKKMHPDIIFAGFQRGEDLARHYASADVFVFASLTETFGNVTLEAMASGLPVLAYNSAAAGELIETGLHGVLIKPNDEHRFMAEAVNLMQNPSALKNMSKPSRQRALSMSWRRIIEMNESVLRSLIL